ncbi:MAG: hypothetical protein DRI90_19295 [Deltaproteobacteria bacterium]|nr:MAG: hypothetical protein DRI90_19295 [Deltaproteobacteria bacterium]
MTHHAHPRVRLIVGLAALCAVASTLSCNDSITGRWKQREAKKPRHSLTAGSDGTGMAEWVYVNSQTGDTIQTDLFELEWEESGTDAYELVLDCVQSSLASQQPECDDRDSTMTCELDGSSKLNCIASEPWHNLTLEFERDDGDDDEPSDEEISH